VVAGDEHAIYLGVREARDVARASPLELITTSEFAAITPAIASAVAIPIASAVRGKRRNPLTVSA
jgi:hypothetical protein